MNLPAFQISIDIPAVAEICQRYLVRRLDVFGSVVNGGFDPGHSDVDVLVAFEDDGYQGFSDRYFGLQEALARVFGRSVDLLTDQSIKNPHVRRSIDHDRRQVFPTQ